jgi:hypothetical protein
MYSNFHRSLFLTLLSLSLSSVWGLSKIWDEITLSLGLAQHNFRTFRLDLDQNPDFIAQHYKSTSPTLQMTWNKEFSKGWHTQWNLDLYYDLNLDSEIAVNNGRGIFEAHSWSADCKSVILFDTDYTHGVKIGAGFGLSNHAIMTKIGKNPQYNYTPLAGPILRFEKHYDFFGVPAIFSAETSKLECNVAYNDRAYHYNWYRYTLDNVILLKSSPDIDQGIRIEYLYWNFDLGRIRNRKWVRDFHGMSWCFEFKFK